MDLTTFYGRETELRDLGFLQDVFNGINNFLYVRLVCVEKDRYFVSKVLWQIDQEIRFVSR